jgi:hypothetical protein
MAALPADPDHEDQLSPERILRALPERERETFLAEYRRALDEARDPARWPDLRRFLRLWAMRAIAVAQPGYYEARDAARAGTGGGMLLEAQSGSTARAGELPSLAGRTSSPPDGRLAR